MGLSITQSEFSKKDYLSFDARVRSELDVLRRLLVQPSFGEGDITIGAECEFYLVDNNGRVSAINQAIADNLNDPLLTLELNRFNLEYNLSPQRLAGSPFTQMGRELEQAMAAINQQAAHWQSKLACIGILPTLSMPDFAPNMMTDQPRYQVFAKTLRAMRGGPFDINIDGSEPLSLHTDYVTLEGANTSYQLHWRVPAQTFANYYNAVQLATPIAIALAANSPSLLQHQLWDETRIALFKQSIDTRPPEKNTRYYPPRVFFGNGWLQDAWQAFATSVVLYPAVIPISSKEDSAKVLADGHIPKLDSLRLHHGTTWPWNRAVYDDNDGGHLRIEFRALPAGPTITDMNANGLLLIGLALALLDDIDVFTQLLPFTYAKYNFYRAAQCGLDAELVWLDKKHLHLQEISIKQLAQQLLPKAKQALYKTQLDQQEIERHFAVLEGRLQTGMTGARWQRQAVTHYRKTTDNVTAHQQMLQQYLQYAAQGMPVHEWPIQP